MFPAPTAIAPEVCGHYCVTIVGETSAVRERYYALSAERRVTHPGVVALSATARVDLFAAHHAAGGRRAQRPRSRTKAS